MRHLILISLAGLVLSGCTTVATTARPDDYYADASYGAVGRGEAEQASLFSSDEAVLSDADIQRILAHRFAPQRLNRVGILTIGQNYWYGWSDELARAGADVQASLVGKLRSSSLVYDASFLPGLLVPEKRTVGHYREAAARYQADLLLIYRPSCRTYEKFRFFAPNEAKSYCNVEAVLLDTRTGIVPFTVIASRDFVAKKQASDYDLTEMRRRSELEALSDALGEAGDEIVAFLARVGR